MHSPETDFFLNWKDITVLFSINIMVHRFIVFCRVYLLVVFSFFYQEYEPIYLANYQMRLLNSQEPSVQRGIFITTCTCSLTKWQEHGLNPIGLLRSWQLLYVDWCSQERRRKKITRSLQCVQLLVQEYNKFNFISNTCVVLFVESVKRPFEAETEEMQCNWKIS